MSTPNLSNSAVKSELESSSDEKAIQTQTPTTIEAAGKLPWADTQREADKDKIATYIAQQPAGCRPAAIATDLFTTDTKKEYDRHNQFVRDFTNRYDLFEITKKKHAVWVSLSKEGERRVSLDPASKHTVGITPKHEEGGDLSTEGDGSMAAANAKAFCRRRRTIETAVERGDLVGSFAAKRAATEDRFHAFEDSFNPGEHLLVPYVTRFNSPQRVAETRERYNEAWDQAAVQFGSALVATLTTDPARYPSIEAAVEGLLDDVNALKDWLAYVPSTGPSRPGFRPPSLVVPQPTERGVPHVHVVFFGVNWLTTHASLRGFWDGKRGRGSVVWLDRLVSRGPNGRWRWATSTEAREHPTTEIMGRSPRAYLAAGVDALAASASVSAAKVKETANVLRAVGDKHVTEPLIGSEGAQGLLSANTPARGPATNEGNSEALERAQGLWMAAWFWAPELQVMTVSPSLRAAPTGETCGRASAPDGTILPADAPPRWRYVGTAQYDEFPASIRATARVVVRRDTWTHPPPSSTNRDAHQPTV